MDDRTLKCREAERDLTKQFLMWPWEANRARIDFNDIEDKQYRIICKAIEELYNSTSNQGAINSTSSLCDINPAINEKQLGILIGMPMPYPPLDLNIDRVKDFAKRRRLRTAGMAIMEIAETSLDISEGVNNAYKLLESIGSEDHPEDKVAKEIVEEFIIEMMSDKEEPGIETHLPKLNHHIKGFQPGDFVVIAAYTNDGKSALMMNFAVHAAQCGHSVGIISLEDSVRKYRNRMMSYLSGVNSSIFRDRETYKLEENKSETLVDAQNEMKKFKMVLNHEAGMTIDDIEGKARYWHRKHNIKILFVDYLQIITNPGAANPREMVMDITVRLTTLCRRLNIVLVTASQMNRNGSSNPTISDIAESSKIEHQADYILIIEADEVLPEGKKEYRRQPVKVVLGKGRDVAKGLVVPIKFDPDRMKLAELPIR